MDKETQFIVSWDRASGLRHKNGCAKSAEEC